MWKANTISRIAKATTPIDIMAKLLAGLQELGAVSGSYHFTTVLSQQEGRTAMCGQFGFPQPWIDLFQDPEFRSGDPISSYVMRAATPCSWKQILAATPKTPARLAFEWEVREQGIISDAIDGLSLPLYGPMSREACCSVFFGRNFEPEDDARIYEILAVAQFAHVSIVQRMRQDYQEKVNLSRRERDVLLWIAQGKSVTDIATILDISPATIDTYFRRIYGKLGVHDRVSAVLTALAYGLIVF